MSALVDKVAALVGKFQWDSAEAENEGRAIAKEIVVAVINEVAGKATPPMPDGSDAVLVKACLVRSRSDPKIGYVVLLEPEPWCPCNDFRFRSPRICYHLQEAIHADSEAKR